MSDTAMQMMPSAAIAPKSAEQIIAQRNAIVDCMRRAMVKEMDYGTVPGTNKPSLFKPGSEKLLSMFHLAARPVVTDLSTPDMIRYQVAVVVTEMNTGRYIGEGVGEASSAEAKYQWRNAVCDQEFDETPEDRRRTKWQKGGSGPYTRKQVRADMEDVANTVLKMAKKRAQIDAVLTVTAASDIFAQDLEDLPSEYVSPSEGEPVPQTMAEVYGAPARQQQAVSAPQRSAAPSAGVAVISEAQSRRAYAIQKSRNVDGDTVKAKLQQMLGITDTRQMPVQHYNAFVGWLEGGTWA